METPVQPSRAIIQPGEEEQRGEQAGGMGATELHSMEQQQHPSAPRGVGAGLSLIAARGGTLFIYCCARVQLSQLCGMPAAERVPAAELTQCFVPAAAAAAASTTQTPPPASSTNFFFPSQPGSRGQPGRWEEGESSGCGGCAVRARDQDGPGPGGIMPGSQGGTYLEKVGVAKGPMRMSGGGPKGSG